MRKPSSLFARLLLLQLGLAVALALVFGLLVYVERNVAVARLEAERWTPALRQATASSAGTPVAPPTLLRSATRPDRGWPLPLAAPRFAVLSDELSRRGLVVRDAVVTRGFGGPVLWLQLRHADGTLAWFGIDQTALLPGPPRRALLAVAIAALLLVAVSWHFTGRLSRPLDALRERIEAQRPGDAGRAEPPPPTAATPEVAAIEAAYDALLRRYDRHERERALLLAGVSHDLRSPLARIRLAAGLLPDDAATAPWREAIARNTEVADRLIGSFLDHVRAGELTLDRDADLAAIARAVAAQASGTGPPPSVHAPTKLTVADSHPLLVERLLANLVDNAQRHGLAPVGVRVGDDGDRVVVEVSDAGPGIPEARRAEWLQAFARGDAARSTPGTGLGLAIVERAVARMGGTLTFSHRDGRHVVRVELPRRRAAQVSPG